MDFRNDAVDAGEIGARHSATAMYAVTFRPNANGRIATIQLRWEDPDTHQVTEIAPLPSLGNFNTWDLVMLATSCGGGDAIRRIATPQSLPNRHN